MWTRPGGLAGNPWVELVGWWQLRNWDYFFREHFSPDSWQAIGVLTSQRWGLRWRTFEPRVLCRVLSRLRWRSLAQVLRRVLCRALSRLRWRSLAKVLCRVLCRVLSRLRWRSLAKVLCRVLSRCCAGCCPDCGGEVWQRCCARC